MKRAVLAFVLAVAAQVAFPFHVQMGFSGYSHALALQLSNDNLRSPSSPWFSVSVEIGATPERVGKSYNFENGRFGENFVVPYETKSDSQLSTGASFLWDDPGSPLLLTYFRGSYSQVMRATIAEAVAIPTFGTSYLPYSDSRVSHGMLTVKGDPYSVVWNDTDSARTINGEQFASREAKALMFPIHLVTAEIPNVKFYDMDSGAEITPYDYAPYGESGKYYYNGYYTLSWSGNIRISDGTAASTNAPLETLVYGDYVSANEDKVLYAASGKPIRSAIVNVTTNFQLQTWWDFTQSEWGSAPKAMINGEVVCDSHSTGHIIAYTVNANNLKVNEFTGVGHAYFTMSQTPASGKSGGNCTMRCWDSKMGGSAEAYANTPAEHKAEVSAGLGVARFKLTINIYAGTWKVEPN